MTSVGSFQANLDGLGAKITGSIQELINAADKTGGDATSAIIKASERNKVVNTAATKVGEVLNNMRA